MAEMELKVKVEMDTELKEFLETFSKRLEKIENTLFGYKHTAFIEEQLELFKDDLK